jgi:hypothetical protein
MAREVATLSVVAIEKLIEQRQNQIEELLDKRDRLESEVQRLDAEIHAFVTNDVVSRRGRRRAKNELSLRTVMLSVLGRNKKGLPLDELAQQISDTGYKSNSRNFKNVVYQCICNTPQVTHDSSTGTYRLAR